MERSGSSGTEPIYEDLGLEMRYPGPMPAEALLLDDHVGHVRLGRIHRRAAQRTHPGGGLRRRPSGPWTVDGAMRLDPGPPGAWDGGGAVTSAVVATPDGFMLWYEGYPEQPGPESIGLATSSDGVTFTKDTDPAIPAGACGTAPNAAVFQPNVLATETAT